MSDPTQDELNRDAIQRGVRARADAIKQQLLDWVEQNTSPADTVPMTIALLEIAVEGHLLGTESHADTLDFVTEVFHRVVHKRQGRSH